MPWNSRCWHHLTVDGCAISWGQEIGFRCDNSSGECRSKFACHLDAFAWVKRDSYLPQGSQGLKVRQRQTCGGDAFLTPWW